MLACLTVVGCARPSFRWDDVRRLRAGMTTDEVQAAVGKPYSVATRGPTEQVWVWIWMDLYTGRSRHFTVEFDDGRATSVPVVPDSFKD